MQHPLSWQDNTLSSSCLFIAGQQTVPSSLHNAPSVHFGIVPHNIFATLSEDCVDDRNRAHAIENLRVLIEDASDIRVIEPYVSDLIEFLEHFIDSANFKIGTATLDVVMTLVSRLPREVVLRSVQTFLAIIIRRLKDDNKNIHESVVAIVTKLMKISSPMVVIDWLCQEGLLQRDRRVRDCRVRQNTINLIIIALLTFPSSDFELLQIAKITAKTLVDTQRSVRQSAFECFAVLAQLLGSSQHSALMSVISDTEKHCGFDGELTLAVSARLANRQLPKCDSSGFVEYATCLNRDAAGQAPADVEWIMAVPPSSKSEGSLSARLPENNFSRGKAAFRSSARILGMLPWEKPQPRRPKENNQQTKPPLPIDLHDNTSDFAAEDCVVPITPNHGYHTDREMRSDFDESSPTHEVKRMPSARALHSSKSRKQIDEMFKEPLNVSKNDSHKSLFRSRKNSTFSTPDIEHLVPYELSEPHVPTREEISGSDSCLSSVNQRCPTEIGKVFSCKKVQRKQRKHSPVDKPITMNAPSTTNNIYAEGKAVYREDTKGLNAVPHGDSRTLPADIKHDTRRVREVAKKTQAEQRTDDLVQTFCVSSPNESQFVTTIDDFERSRRLDGPGGGKNLRSGINGPLLQRKPPSCDVRKTKQPKMKQTTGMRRAVSDYRLTDGDVTASQPFADPTYKRDTALEQIAELDPSKWMHICEGLHTISVLAYHHQRVFNGYLHSVVLAVITAIRSLRSVVCQCALKCLADMYHYLKMDMIPELATTVPVLLKKAGEISNFIRDDAVKTLKAMVDSVPPQKALAALIAGFSGERNAVIRGVIARFIADIAKTLGPDQVLSGAKDITDCILSVAAQFMLDASPEVRHSGQTIFFDLMNHRDFDQMLVRCLSPDVLRSIQDKLESLQQKGLRDPSTRSLGRKPSSRYASSPGEKPMSKSTPTSAVGNPRSRVAVPKSESSEDVLELTACLSDTGDFKERSKGLEQLRRVATTNVHVLVYNITVVFDRFIPCLKDANKKVNLLALDVLGDIVPYIAPYVANVITLTVKTVVPNLASLNHDISSAAARVLNEFVVHIDPFLLLPSFVNQALSGNLRYKSEMVDRVTSLVPKVFTTPRARQSAQQHILPLVWSLLSASPSNAGAKLQAATAHLVSALHSQIGSDLIDAANNNASVSLRGRQMLRQIIDGLT